MTARTIIIGAGMGGLACAARLASAGHDVTVLEKEGWAGGKARQVAIDGAMVDAGPTVFTLRDVFDDIFQTAGRDLDDYVTVRPAEVLARHAWDADGQLDLFADPERSEDAIGAFAGGDAARGYCAFRKEAARIYGILENSMLRASKVSWPLPLMWRIGLWRVGDLLAIRPYESMWKVLGEHFADQRLRQLFARYSTYCGSSPFSTPATLMLIAHVEARGVWLIEGGMSAMADALRRLAEEKGARIRFGAKVSRIEVDRGRAWAVTLNTGERIAADAVVANADPAALADGRFGQAASGAVNAPRAKNRSLSAMVWLAHARTSGFPLSRHNVMFSPDYPREFAEIRDGRPPADPSVYVCAQDRDANGGPAPRGRERLQIIVNAPANGDTHSYTQQEMEQCTTAMMRSCARAGLMLEDPLPHSLATPNTFEGLFPSTGGALYGRASHGWAASFLRQGTRTRIAGLYCAGGSTHPGAGVPMAALSGGLAATAVAQDLALMRRFHKVVMPGGMSTQSATTGSTA
ncbi:1-hydroxycarotenoid 3,4-desaturase CrtD [Aurantiacibacter odishensis]|uniref:1-hydroxycarotenoid 3,4-desaturase CrtD n=1 Tax=Aurantiacibacter odishensis TaxID=1155476 RepID=UPI000E723C4A|nr:1-hydroxycarotenoid 3,4-desaturase CrtD [Aurantiacibacter odishensis]